MSSRISESEAAAILAAGEDIEIITHRRPDGDTLGSAFALWAALRKKGIRAKVVCCDEITDRYSMIRDTYNELADADFEPKMFVAVDVAAGDMMGSNGYLADKCVLCIDHHGSNTGYAENLCLDSESASCCEVILRVIDELGVELDNYIATALYVGMSTDTGCFVFRNTKPETHEAAARVMRYGVNTGDINSRLFEQKTRKRIAVETAALQTVEYFFDDRMSLITIDSDLIRRTNAGPEELDGLNALARSIEGIEVGVTVRETGKNAYKVSLRSSHVDSSAVCAVFGGGGHFGAAGFEVSSMDYETLKKRILEEVGKIL